MMIHAAADTRPFSVKLVSNTTILAISESSPLKFKIEERMKAPEKG